MNKFIENTVVGIAVAGFMVLFIAIIFSIVKWVLGL